MTTETTERLSDDTAELVQRAAAGDRRAWDRLVDRYIGLLWSITRSFRLRDSDAADVVQTTWLRLLEHVDRLNDPERVGAWLATTARRECLRVLAHSNRVVPLGDDDKALLERPDPGSPDVDARLVAEETAHMVRQAVEHLPPHWRQLLDLLMTDPPMSYEEISATLGVPVGSIGPTRGRCLRRLRTLVEV